jgi:hypothetical protein
MALALVAATTACAGAHLPMPAPASTRLNRAVDALERGRHADAVAELVSLAGSCPATPVERYALLLATAASIDPRNPSRRLSEGAALAARYLATVPSDESGGRPLAQAFYLLAVELGAKPPPAAAQACPAASAAAVVLPVTEVPTVADRMRAMERELAGLREELARIRKTLEP